MFTALQINVAAFKQCGGSKVLHKKGKKEKKTHKVKKWQQFSIFKEAIVSCASHFVNEIKQNKRILIERHKFTLYWNKQHSDIKNEIRVSKREI